MRRCVPVTAFVQNCRPCGSDVNTKGSSTKESWDVSSVYLFIYLFFLLFYLIIIFFLLECLWSAKMLGIEGQLTFTKPHLFGHFFSPGTRAGSDHD